MTNDEASQFQTLRPTNELKEIFQNNGIDLNKPLTATCGIGLFSLLSLYRTSSLHVSSPSIAQVLYMYMLCESQSGP